MRNSHFENMQILNNAIVRGKDNVLVPAYVKDALNVLPNILNDLNAEIDQLKAMVDELGAKNGS